MDFKFIQRPHSKKWSILDPRRSTRPDAAKKVQPVCPFCVGSEGENQQLDRFVENNSDEWLVNVIANKFPFAPVHELIIHSPDHHKNINELPLSHAELIFKMYQKRYKEHQSKGTVLLFHNRGEQAGESLPHPHTQLVVLPHEMNFETPVLTDLMLLPEGIEKPLETEHFVVFSSKTAQWPDEVVIAPKRRKVRFGDVVESELADGALVMRKVVNILNGRLGEEFPFNFYIYPLYDWYVRIVPSASVTHAVPLRP